MNEIFVLRIAGCILLLAITACATSIERPVLEKNYTLQVTDNAAERRFDVVLKSQEDRALCVSIEAWPSGNGLLPTASDEVALLIGQEKLPVRSELLSAYCPGGCGVHRIAPHGELRGFIAYGAFGNETQLAADPSKQLQFSVVPSYCRK